MKKNYQLTLLFIIAGLLSSSHCSAQFRKVTNGPFVNDSHYSYAGGTWGDADNDKDYDVFVPHTAPFYTEPDYYYINNGRGGLVRNYDVEFVQPSYDSRAGAWGDYDGDGLLDLFVGVCPFPESEIGTDYLYKNLGDNQFISVPIATQELCTENASWADYDNDGDLDLFVAGFYNSLYRNNGDGSFTQDYNVPFSTHGGNNGRWADYDKDGDLDLIISGGPSFSTYLYDNLGNGNFQRSNAITIGSNNASWGDFNNDGYPDLSLVFIDLSSPGVPRSELYIYENMQNGTFQDLRLAPYPDYQVIATDCQWADIDNDGDLDLIIAFLGTSFVQVYTNLGNANFSVSPLDPNPTVSSLACHFVDVDLDNDLDISTGGHVKSTLHKNVTTYKNTLPSAVGSVQARANKGGTSVTFSWTPATDAETPGEGLSYNLRIGTYPGGNDVMPSMSHDDGFRKVVDWGNTSQSLSWTIKNLTPGRYYWSVQAIDQDYAGGPFYREQTFVLRSPFTSPRTTARIGEDDLIMETPALNLYPNPASSELHVSLQVNDEGTLSLVDASGTILLVSPVSLTPDKEVLLDVSSLPAGMYIAHYAGRKYEVKERVFVK